MLTRYRKQQQNNWKFVDKNMNTALNISIHIHILPKQITRWYIENILDRIHALHVT